MSKLITGIGLSLLSTVAMAHEGHAHTLLSSALHPILGWDHLLAMILVGMASQQRLSHQLNSTGVRHWGALAYPLGFMAMTAAGLLLAAPLVSMQLPYETIILASVLTMGLIVALPHPVRPSPILLMLILLFGLMHGVAHGAELGGNPLEIALGMLIGTGLLHATGYMLSAQMAHRPWAQRGVGVLGVLTASLAGMGAL